MRGNCKILLALEARDAALEAWLRDEVAKSYDKSIANPGIGIPAEKIMERLRASSSPGKAKAGMTLYSLIFRPHGEDPLDRLFSVTPQPDRS